MVNNSWDASFYQSKHNFVTTYGEGVVDMLSPKSGEVILDIGCGTGELTTKIAESGARIYGIDFAENMVNQAKINNPNLNFTQHNAELPFPFKNKFDAVFSNAALHWMLKADDVVKNIANSLNSGGRFVFEMGGKGNINKVINAIELAANDFNIKNLPIYNYFPSISEYSSILEANGFIVKYALLFERPTKLDGVDGLKNWVKMFRNSILNKLDISKQNRFLEIIENYAKKDLFIDDNWFADYVRLRMVAIKS